MITSPQNIVISDVDAVKILIKMTRLENIVFFILMFCDLVTFLKNFDLSTSGGLEHLKYHWNYWHGTKFGS